MKMNLTIQHPSQLLTENRRTNLSNNGETFKLLEGLTFKHSLS